jgi:NAD(P)-dependent dehydrogenase (short-subunit alcohol dehydrogenase family)|eukprot:g1465.t1
MSSSSPSGTAAVFTIGAACGLFLARFLQAPEKSYSMADQPARFAHQKNIGDTRALDIDQHYDASALKGKRVLITGANRGLGLAIATEAQRAGALVYATCRRPSSELQALGVTAIIPGIDVAKTETMDSLVNALSGIDSIDIVINNAGYFMRERESILGQTMDYGEEMKMIDICAVGQLRVTSALYNGGKLAAGSKVAMITSQGGSIAWRDTQCPEGGDYGHHLSKAAANMGGKLAANELKSKGIVVSVLHPGFVRTEMTSKYSHIWDIEGAVVSSVASKRVLHEINIATIASSGVFINCEDGQEIPW